MASPVLGRGRIGILMTKSSSSREGWGAWTVNGKTFEGGAGDIFVIKAGEIHTSRRWDDAPVVSRHPP